VATARMSRIAATKAATAEVAVAVAVVFGFGGIHLGIGGTIIVLLLSLVFKRDFLRCWAAGKAWCRIRHRGKLVRKGTRNVMLPSSQQCSSCRRAR